MFALDVLVHVAPISVLARVMEAKIEYLRTFQRILPPAQRTWWPAEAVAASAASPPAAILAAVRGAARGGRRPEHVPRRDEPIPPLPPCDRRTTKKPAIDMQYLWESAVRLAGRRGCHYDDSKPLMCGRPYSQL